MLHTKETMTSRERVLRTFNRVPADRRNHLLEQRDLVGLETGAKRLPGEAPFRDEREDLLSRHPQRSIPDPQLCQQQAPGQ